MTAATLVQRRLSTRPDPCALYAVLGVGPDTALFEGMAGPSLLMPHAAVRAECRGEQVTMRALSANGASLLKRLRDAIPGAIAHADELTLGMSIPRNRSLDAEQRLRAPSPLHAIRALLRTAMPESEEPFAALAIGVVAFDHAAAGEDLPDNPEDHLGFPDYVFWVPESLVLFEPGLAPRILCAAFDDPDPDWTARNHHDAVARLSSIADACGRVPTIERAEPFVSLASSVEADLDDAAYMAVVRRLKGEIAAGEVYQIVPSRTFRIACSQPLRAFEALRQVEPHSYRFFVQGADFTLLGASPETSVRLFKEDGVRMAEVRPIAGTRPRGRTGDEDDRLESELRLDDKELAAVPEEAR